MAFKLKNKQIKEIVSQLRTASKTHAAQADKIESAMNADSPMQKKGEKDACYYKVKSRNKKWPTAYGSGQLVQCRKVGAANWGNKSKKK